MIRLACPKCDNRLEFAAAAAGSVVRCPGCKAKLKLPGRPPPPEDDDEPVEAEVVEPPVRHRPRRRTVDPETIRDWVVPAALAAVGMLLSVGVAYAVGHLFRGPAGGIVFADAALRYTAFNLLASVPVSVLGMYLAAFLFDLEFGRVGSAVLKIVAITVFIQGLFELLLVRGTSPLGLLCAGLMFGLPLYAALLAGLFRLTFVEALKSAAVLLVLRWFATFLLMGLLFPRRH